MTETQLLSKTALLQAVEKRVLWLATYLVHYANNLRPNVEGVKVGGHQTSSASVATVMTALYFDFLRAGDKVSIKPHASPVFHAIQFLLGNLDGRYLKTLREFHGLQSYPSRTKDPDQVDFSTGSVGIGSVAPNFAALVEDYLRSRPGSRPAQGRRVVSLVGDAELDEGSVWEAIAEPALQNLAHLTWIVDLNRQSLDRIIPGIRVRCWREMFAANGWTVIDVKYGRRLQSAFALPNGELLRTCIDELSNDAYQRLLRLPAASLRQWLPTKSRFPRDLTRLLARWDDAALQDLFWNLGGHDFAALGEALAQVNQTSGPAVVFAYTLKGWGLPTVGHARNHSALLSAEEIEALRLRSGVAAGAEWAGFDPDSEEGRFCAETGEQLQRAPQAAPVEINPVPPAVGCVHTGWRSTQQTFGNILTAILREAPDLGGRMVTMSPDVASSTNLGGWINKTGVWQKHAREELPSEPEGSALKWTESPHGQHIELGLSENNLFMALGQFGLARELFGEVLFPVGTLYDPFVRRGLDAFFYSCYSGGKFIVVGTPSGITLAGEGGAHQSLGSQSIGTEMPGLRSYEPCFGQELEWIFLDALEQVRLGRASTYFRLSTKAIDQGLFPAPATPAAELRLAVIRGGYRMVDRSGVAGYSPGRNTVTIFAVGVLVPEAIQAGERLLEEGILANVINVTGPGPLYQDFQACRGHGGAGHRVSHIETLVPPADRVAPVITLIDDHPHTLAWVGGALGARSYPLGVTAFGQSGSCRDLYREYGLDAASVVAIARRALGRNG